MKLVRFAFSGASGPVRTASGRLAQLTTVIGRNDSGKSRMVRDFAGLLSDDGASVTSATSGAIYAELTFPERDALLGSLDDDDEPARRGIAADSSLERTLTRLERRAGPAAKALL